MTCVECALSALLLIIVLGIFAYLLPKEAKGIKSVAQSIKKATGSCLPQTLPFKNERYGSAEIKVSAGYHYDPAIGTYVCEVLDITIEISGANPNTEFKVYANYITIYNSGGTGQDASWTYLASGTTDDSGNLVINTGTANPSGSGGCQVIVAVVDSTCDNLLIQKLPQTLCSRETGLRQTGFKVNPEFLKMFGKPIIVKNPEIFKG